MTTLMPCSATAAERLYDGGGETSDREILEAANEIISAAGRCQNYRSTDAVVLLRESIAERLGADLNDVIRLAALYQSLGISEHDDVLKTLGRKINALVSSAAIDAAIE